MCHIVSHSITTMVYLNEVQRAQVATKIESGSYPSIVAEEFQISKSTALRIYRKWRNEARVNRNIGSGRPKISNAEHDALLCNVLRRNPFESAVTATNISNFPGTVRTARRRLQESGLRNYSAARAPFLTQIHKEARIGFSLEFMVNGMDFWNRVIFSDEKTFQSYYDGRMRVYRPQNMRHNEKYTHKIKKSGHFSINVWACISYNGRGAICRLQNRLNGDAYINILENILVPYARNNYQNNFIFQQDNCRAHTCIATRNWFEENHIEVLPWPANSPDLNPMENLWGIMTKKNYNSNFRAHTSEELWQQIVTCWEALDLAHVQNLITSMPKRLEEIIKENGSKIKY